MRILMILGALLPAFPQTIGEFDMHPNGLIYSEETVATLRHYVEVEGRNFYACPKENTYASTTYYLANYVILRCDFKTWETIGEQVKRAETADALVNLFPDRVLFNFNDVPVVRYKNYQNNWVWYEAIFGNDLKPSKQASPEKSLVGPIRNVSLSEKEPVVFAVFPQTLPAQAPVKPAFAELVDYVDCMVGNVPILQEPDLDQPEGSGNALEEFNDYLAFGNYPTLDWKNSTKEEREQYPRDQEAWRQERETWIHEVRAKTPKFTKLLKAAIVQAKATGAGSFELEDLAATYVSEEEALAIMRGRRVIGNCSKDQSPRIHAQRIAKLAAEKIQWDIFLRAHLNILNDNFQRMSDGSYAYGRRHTYIRELEALGLDLPKLIPGLALRIGDALPNHYAGSPSRLGRALVEAEEPQPVIAAILSMLTHHELDPPNKVRLGHVLTHYLHNLDPGLAQVELEEMVAANPHLPPYFVEIARHFFSN